MWQKLVSGLKSGIEAVKQGADKLAAKCGFRKIAVLAVDPLNDFFPGGSLPVEGGHDIIPACNKVLERADQKNVAVVIARDSHPEKTSHFDKWPAHCVAGTTGAMVHSLLYIPSVVYYVWKGTEPDTDDYSSFDGHDGSEELGSLDDILSYECHTNVLLVMGLALDYCVRDTLLDAVRLGYKTYLVIDATRAVNQDPEVVSAVLLGLRLAGVTIITSDEAVALIDKYA